MFLKDPQECGWNKNGSPIWNEKFFPDDVADILINDDLENNDDDIHDFDVDSDSEYSSEEYTDED